MAFNILSPKQALFLLIRVQVLIIATTLFLKFVWTFDGNDEVIFHTTQSLSAWRPLNQIPAFVITLQGKDNRVPYIIELFRKYTDIQLRPYYGVNGREKYFNKNGPQLPEAGGLSPGERGLRETMENFFMMADSSNYSEVLSFEDDAIPHTNFSRLIYEMNDRCQEADILLLGASFWHRNHSHWPKDVCPDVDNQTLGSHALLVKRSAFPAILQWLRTGPAQPFDMIYRHLQTQGISVRLAYPPILFITDVTHSSAVNPVRTRILSSPLYRAARHGWNLQNYPIISFDNFTSRAIEPRKVSR